MPRREIFAGMTRAALYRFALAINLINKPWQAIYEFCNDPEYPLRAVYALEHFFLAMLRRGNLGLFTLLDHLHVREQLLHSLVEAILRFLKTGSVGARLATIRLKSCGVAPKLVLAAAEVFAHFEKSRRYALDLFGLEL